MTADGVFVQFSHLTNRDWFTFDKANLTPVLNLATSLGRYAAANLYDADWIAAQPPPTFVLRNLIQRIPDIYFETWAHPNMAARVAPCSVRLEERKANHDAPGTSVATLHVDLDPSSSSELLDMMKDNFPSWDLVDASDSTADFRRVDAEDALSGDGPPLRDATTGRTFLLLATAESAPSMPEMCELFVLAYLMGNLARYYPQVWMGRMRRRPETALIVERCLAVLRRRYPQLFLNAIYGRPFHFPAVP